MNTVLFVIGIFLVGFAFFDALQTTLWLNGGAGKVTSLVSSGIWTVFRRTVGSSRPDVLTIVGPVTLLVTVLAWVVLIWTGWSLVFISSVSSVVSSSSGQAASWMDKVYFVGYIFFSGTGNLRPDGHLWQIMAVLTSAGGLALVSLSVTYLISIVSAVVTKRAIASSITGLGRSPSELLHNVWTGHGFDELNTLLLSLSSRIGTLSEQHRAYPILHNYHAGDRKESPALAISILYDALNLVEYGIEPRVRPAPVVLRSVRSAIHEYIDTLSSTASTRSAGVPPLPNLQALREAGIPALSDEAFKQSMDNLAENRRSLHSLVEHEAFQWPVSQE